jgi:predicted RNA-binding protein with RPS1 domain
VIFQQVINPVLGWYWTLPVLKIDHFPTFVSMEKDGSPAGCVSMSTRQHDFIRDVNTYIVASV